jgi:hypothetical protein
MKKPIFLIFLFLLIAFQSMSATYYVSNNGNNGYTKTQAQNESTPWKTIQKAANEVTAGDVVIISGGTYNEYITLPSTCNGTANNLITFKSKEGETAIINGVGGWIWIALIETNRGTNNIGNNYLKFERLKLQNSYFFGFKFENCSNIYVENCHTYKTGGSGIYFNKSSYVYARNNKIEEACLNTNTSTNSQECITLSNTNNFEVSGNEVFNAGGATGGEGIDAKGNSHTGIISGNYVHDLNRYRGGIYVDSWNSEAHNIRIFGNLVERTQHGIMIAGEQAGHTREIYIYNNISRNNFENGFLQHQYGNGRFSDIYVENNTFVNNGQTENTTAGDIWFQNNNANNVRMFVRNNICSNGGSQYDFNIRIRLQDKTTVSNNLSYPYKTGQNNVQGSSAVVSAPLFVDAAAGDYRLQSGSPAIDKGTSSLNPFITADYDGLVRPQGSAFDMGAFEYKDSSTGFENSLLYEKLFRLYPNPAKNKVTLRSASGKVWKNIEMTNLSGMKVPINIYQTDIKTEIYFEKVTAGVYVLCAFDGLNFARETLIIQ